MSADAWRICPDCLKNKEQLRKDLYGKVPESDYLAFLNSEKEKPEEALREDYEIYTDKSGVFTISYSCYCTVCGFSFDFKHKEQLEF